MPSSRSYKRRKNILTLTFITLQSIEIVQRSIQLFFQYLEQKLFENDEDDISLLISSHNTLHKPTYFIPSVQQSMQPNWRSSRTRPRIFGSLFYVLALWGGLPPRSHINTYEDLLLLINVQS